VTTTSALPRALRQASLAVAAIVVFEARMMAAVARAVLRRPIAPPSVDGEAFGVLESGSYRLVAAVLVGLSIVELGALQLLLRGVLGGGHVGVHLGVVALHVYGVAWIVGDARALGETRHVVGARAVSLRLGLRAAADVPRDAIVFAGSADALAPAAAKKAVRLTPLDAPNVALSLAHAVDVTTAFGRRRRAKHLLLFVDRPAAFAAALAPEG
jgi:hypothetical protein